MPRHQNDRPQDPCEQDSHHPSSKYQEQPTLGADYRHIEKDFQTEPTKRNDKDEATSHQKNASSYRLSHKHSKHTSSSGDTKIFSSKIKNRETLVKKLKKLLGFAGTSKKGINSKLHKDHLKRLKKVEKMKSKHQLEYKDTFSDRSCNENMVRSTTLIECHIELNLGSRAF